MKHTARRLTSYLLALVLVLSLFSGLSLTTLAADGDVKTVLAFSSDVHNKSNNTSADRLGTWIDLVKSSYGKLDAMAFGGDLGDASASTSNFWTYVQAVMDTVSGKGVTGVYTTGNHEYSPGDYRYGTTYTDPPKSNYTVSGVGDEGENYIIYCLGSTSGSENYSSQVSSLDTALKSFGTDKPIFIITHFPLHTTSSSSSSSSGWGGWGRTTTGAGDVIDVLNDAASRGQKITFLFGHNHTLVGSSETNYDKIFTPGDSITYASGSSKTIQFYYGAAGCMSDSEYGSGSGNVKGKGLVVTFGSDDKLSFAYLTASGSAVSGGTYTEGDEPYTPPTPTDPPSGGSSTTAPKTGDETPIALYAALAVISLGAVGAGAWLILRKNKKK